MEYGQRLALRRRNCLAPPGASSGQALFDGALAGGGQALGAPAWLAPGMPADIVSLDATHPSLVGRGGDDIMDGFVFSAAQAVDCVWRRGVKCVAGGVHTGRARIVADYARVLKRLRACPLPFTRSFATISNRASAPARSVRANAFPWNTT